MKYSARPKVYYIVSQKICRTILTFVNATSQDNYLDPDESYWAFHNQTPAFHVGRKLTAGVMSSVRAGLTEPLQHCESLRSIQLLLKDGDKDWLGHISECAQHFCVAQYFTHSVRNRVPLSITFATAFGVEYDSPELKEAKMVRPASIFPFPFVPAAYIADIDRPSKNLSS